MLNPHRLSTLDKTRAVRIGEEQFLGGPMECFPRLFRFPWGVPKANFDSIMSIGQIAYWVLFKYQEPQNPKQYIVLAKQTA